MWAGSSLHMMALRLLETRSNNALITGRVIAVSGVQAWYRSSADEGQRSLLALGSCAWTLAKQQPLAQSPVRWQPSSSLADPLSASPMHQLPSQWPVAICVFMHLCSLAPGEAASVASRA